MPNGAAHRNRRETHRPHPRDPAARLRPEVHGTPMDRSITFAEGAVSPLPRAPGLRTLPGGSHRKWTVPTG